MIKYIDQVNKELMDSWNFEKQKDFCLIFDTILERW